MSRSRFTRSAGGAGGGGGSNRTKRSFSEVANNSPLYVNLTDGINEVPGVLKVIAATGDTVEIAYSDTAPTGPWTVMGTFTADTRSYEVDDSTKGLRLTRTAGSGASRFVYDPVAVVVPAGRDLGSMTWAALQAAYPDGSAELLALPDGSNVFITDRDARYERNGAGARWRVMAATSDAASVASSRDISAADDGAELQPTGTLTLTITTATAWPARGGCLIALPASGTVSFAVSGGPTLNGGTTTLTRTLAGNPSGIVALSRIQGTNAYGLTGA